MNWEEERLFKRLLKEQSPEPPFDASAGTTPVQPSSPRDGLADYSAPGRGNDPSRSGGPNIPPRTVGLEEPSPPQSTGSNLPGSGIAQLPGVLQQTPGIVFAPNKNKVVVPAVHDSSFVARTPSEAFLSDNEPRSPGVGYPRLASPEGDSSSSDASAGHGNSNAPFGSVGPRTSAGANANPDVSDNELPHALKQQIKQPIVMPPLKENPSYLNPSSYKMTGGHGGTIEQGHDKPNATDSAGVVKLSDDFVNAGTRRVRKGGPSATWFEKEGA